MIRNRLTGAGGSRAFVPAAVFAVLALSVAVLALSASGCDMSHMTPARAVTGGTAADSGSRVISEAEKNELEKSGHFLKLVNMPLTTQITNVFSVSVANSASSIAKLNSADPVKIYNEKKTSLVYLPLVYNNNEAFTENGKFYVAFTVHVDAVTSFVVAVQDRVLVPFTDGRGSLDVSSLNAPKPDGFMTEKERAELERTGRFLKLTYMPLNTQFPNVSSVSVANSASAIAKLDSKNSVKLYNEGSSCSVYLPLAYNDGSEFIENGSFYAAFVIHVDANVGFVITLDDKILVPFRDGRGELDVRTLPYKGPVPVDRRHLTITGLPPTLLAENVSNVFVHNQAGPVAKCQDYSLLLVSSVGGESTVGIPLAYSSNSSVFTGTGSFYVSFDITVDAVVRYEVAATDGFMVSFVGGNGSFDIGDLPKPPSPDRRCLTVTGLPPTLLAGNVTDVFVHNMVGPVARCEDYGLLEISVNDGKAQVSIPLVSTADASLFTGTGGFYVALEINVDASTRYEVTDKDRVMVSFTAGNGSLDIGNLPKPPPPDRRYLTLTNLPSNLIAGNVINVFVHNMVGPVARCADYKLLEISVNAGKAQARIPLVSSVDASLFTGTGGFYVSFEINIDASTRFEVLVTDRVTVSFTNGNGSLDITKLPPPPPIPYLTLLGVPKETTRRMFSDVFVYNAAGKVAKCASYDDIVISNTTALIPLAYEKNEGHFRDSGRFTISFTVTVDIERQYIKRQSDSITITFANGSGTYDMSVPAGYFSGALVNPDDTLAPVVRNGTALEMNGFYYQISANKEVAVTMPLSESCLLYIYAVQKVSGGIDFEYSTVAPAFNSVKAGYYSGDKRALWKMCFYKSQNGSEFLAKTLITGRFTHLYRHTVDPSRVTASVFLSRAGATNPATSTLTLSEGAYVFVVVGAGGGSGGDAGQRSTIIGPSIGTLIMTRNGGGGGRGGTFAELVILDRAAQFSFYAGGGGRNGESMRMVDTGYTFSTPNAAMPIEAPRSASGGGGGSGSFAYSDDGYFLCAGGGGGGSGASSPSNSFTISNSSPYSLNVVSYGGAGGAGGSIGPGGAGGNGASAGGFGDMSFDSTTVGQAGSGGGASGPIPSGLSTTTFGYNGTAAGNAEPGEAAFFYLSSTWKSTSGSNGQGGNGAGSDSDGRGGGDGGNNRNSSRGDGAARGTAGSVTVYRLY
jgi:hypothetical protein